MEKQCQDADDVPPAGDASPDARRRRLSRRLTRALKRLFRSQLLPQDQQGELAPGSLIVGIPSRPCRQPRGSPHVTRTGPRDECSDTFAVPRPPHRAHGLRQRQAAPGPGSPSYRSGETQE